MIWAWLWQHLWPGWDALYPNVLASVICGSVVWLWARRHVRRLHRLHDEIRAAVASLHAHTEKQVAAPTADTNRLVRALADQLGIDPNTGQTRLPRPRPRA